MKIERKDSGQITILRIAGDIDDVGMDTLRTSRYELSMEGRYRVVLNLSDVRFVTYLGIGELVTWLRKARALDGDIKLVAASLYTQRLMRMVGVSALFDSFETETQAAGAFGQ